MYIGSQGEVSPGPQDNAQRSVYTAVIFESRRRVNSHTYSHITIYVCIADILGTKLGVCGGGTREQEHLERWPCPLSVKLLFEIRKHVKL